MLILNIAGYKFIALSDLESLRTMLLDQCSALSLKGTILLSHEGININLAGIQDAIHTFQDCLKNDLRFETIPFHETYSYAYPFQHLKIKIKNEIITMHKPEINPVELRAPSILPTEFKQWLDEKRDMTVLDTRNDYEVRFGTFAGAMNLHIADFSELPATLKNIDRDKPIVMFCTGGIRCEKAALYMLNQGFPHVFQLDGGILGYFNQVGGTHYEGECFVFDERVSVDSSLNPTGTVQCHHCQGPVTQSQQNTPGYVPGVSCPSCVK